MTFIYEQILYFINALFPNNIGLEFAKLNELLAYVITLGFVWALLIRPLLKAFKVIK